MNFLAHVQLSRGEERVIMGNLVADAYKGKKYLELDEKIQWGIILHRKIDFFTDTFPAVTDLKRLLAPYFGRYAGVALDVYFDHMLSKNWNHFHEGEMHITLENVYGILDRHMHLVNTESREFLLRLIQYKWLSAYKEVNTMEKIFEQMAKRFSLEVLKNSRLPLESHFQEIEKGFLELYPLLIEQSDNYLKSVRL